MLFWPLLIGVACAWTTPLRSHIGRSAATCPIGMSTSSTTTVNLADELVQVLSQTSPLPKVLVFDLDNTLWFPELYQIRQKKIPKVNQQINLFEDARAILQALHQMEERPVLALASRTNKVDWAQQLLDEFEIEKGVTLRSLFAHMEIFPSSKKTHFANIRQATGFAYSEMLFYDDDARMNCKEISQLGVMSCHTPRGLTAEHFTKSLDKYAQLKAGHDASHWMGYVLNSENLGIQETQAESGQVLQGRIKFYSVQKHFGFVVDEASGQDFFFHESKVPAGMSVKTGDKVSFESNIDAQGRPSAVILSDSTNGSSPTAVAVETLPCFTMSQPFCALLLNGVKTIESRNNNMFQSIKPGTRILLHCGRKDWHDMESYRQILSQEGMSNDEIDRLGRLPKGFGKGSIVGIVTVGKTRKMTDSEMLSRDLQRRVLAPFDGIGQYCTEIINAKWLKKPVKARGSPGVYEAGIPTSYLPDDI